MVVFLIFAAGLIFNLSAQNPLPTPAGDKGQVTKKEAIAPAVPVQPSTGTSAQTVVEHKTADSPTDVIKKYEQDVKEVVTKYRGKDDPQSQKNKNEEILVKVRQFFDIGELAMLSLGPIWDRITVKEREEYRSVFSTLVEKSYVSKSDKLVGDYEVKYIGEEIKGEKATVKSDVIKKDANVDLTYYMHRKSERWMIYNIVADTTNLVKNYNSSFNGIVAKEGFGGLMKRMKSKLAEQED